MGIYTNNRYLTESVHDYASEIPANEAYDAALGCAKILADCQANDMTLFEATIYDDFNEVRSIQEGTYVLNENAFSGIIKKIIETFKKLLGKIKGIFSAFIAKLTGAFKDGKGLVNKYEKQIIKYSNWKDFKCKHIRVPNSSNTKGIKESINDVFKTNSNNSALTYTIGISGTNVTMTTGLDAPYNNDAKKIIDADKEDIKEKILKKYFNGVTISDEKDIHTEVMDKLFEDEDTISGDDQVHSASYFSSDWIKGILNEDKWLKDIKKFNDKLEKNINQIIDNLNKTDDNLAKFIVNNKNKTIGKFSDNFDNNFKGADSTTNKVKKLSANFDAKDSGGASTENVQKAIHALQKIAGIDQEVITKVTSEYMTVYKFTMAQARKLWVAAAAWSSTTHKNEAVEYDLDYVNAVSECAVDQFYSNMECIH